MKTLTALCSLATLALGVAGGCKKTEDGSAGKKLTEGSGNGPLTETAFGLARGLQYAMTALALGGLAFLLLAWLPALTAVGDGGGEWSRAGRAFATRLRRVLLFAATLGAISAAAGITLEGAEAAGIS